MSGSGHSRLAPVVRHELRLAWRSRTFVALAATLMLLTVGAAIVGVERQRAQDAQRSRYQEIVRRQFQDQPDRHPHRVSHYGFLLFRPAAPLGFFDTGVLSFTGVSLFLEAHRQNSANFSDASQSDGVSRFGELTLASLLQLFVPLLLFLVAGPAVTREREAGTLALLLCQGTAPGAVLWGKLLATLLMGAAVLVPGLAIGTAWLMSGSAFTWRADTLGRAALLAAVHLIYILGCAALALLVSAWAKSSRGALGTLLGLWISLWVVLPRALPALGAALHPLPARAAFEAEVEATVRRLGNSHDPNDPRFRELRTATLARYGAARIEDLPLNYSGIVMAEAERLTADAYREHVARLNEAYGRQARIIEAASFVSPFVAVRTASMALAGVDLPHALDFESQAEEFRYRLVQRLNDLHTTAVPHARDRYEGGPEGGTPSRMRIDRAHWAQLPSFAYEPPSLAWAVSGQPLGLSALAGWGLLLVVGLAWRARRRFVP